MKFHPKNGYVYFFNLSQKKDIMKIGRTVEDPIKRLSSVATKEKAKLEIYDWIKLNHYDVIEKELHEAFNSHRIMREWFQIQTDEIDETVKIYRLTDTGSLVYSEQKEKEADESDLDFLPPSSSK